VGSDVANIALGLPLERPKCMYLMKLAQVTELIGVITQRIRWTPFRSSSRTRQVEISIIVSLPDFAWACKVIGHYFIGTTFISRKIWKDNKNAMHGIVHRRDSRENADILKKAKLDRSLKDERGSNPESARHL
jgi:hypothetical protein